ncbi:hypothetical protein BV25DRAFT_1178013 [Artomyces pyxidatus]|uniref:Uncharacterized protein n=1 Tax=Artomyces pyxidatus TaxID=48021 RepID=A0ACB8SSU2_9AGAM|nr:hypothetical protein BV25DRAFT_1178013 [Artomyces pyxidatus]
MDEWRDFSSVLLGVCHIVAEGAAAHGVVLALQVAFPGLEALRLHGVALRDALLGDVHELNVPSLRTSLDEARLGDVLQALAQERLASGRLIKWEICQG